jgi:hypothetical protein
MVLFVGTKGFREQSPPFQILSHLVVCFLYNSVATCYVENWLQTTRDFDFGEIEARLARARHFSWNDR